MSRVRFTPEARTDLHDIWDYIARDNVDSASRFTDTIEEKCRLLGASPEMGRGRPELAPDLRSFPVGNYVIFVRVDPSVRLRQHDKIRLAFTPERIHFFDAKTEESLQ